MNKNILKLSVFFLFSLIFINSTLAQSTQLIKRTTYKTETAELGVGGTVTIVGAPNGSITFEGWSKNEVEVSAEIEMQAATESDLAILASISGFMLDEQFGHIRIVSLGTHDKDYMKQAAKKFPKNLLNSPLKIDYKVKVPKFCDLDINSGKGDLRISSIEGSMLIKGFEGDANLDLIGGTVNATFGSGNIDIKINSRSWRGRQAIVQVAKGTLNVQFPQNMNAEVDANVLRTGKIENSLTSFKPRDRSKFSETSMLARAGNGGALFSFTVGEGTLKMSNW